MSYFKVLSLVGGQVIDKDVDESGIMPAVTIANAAVYDTGISGLTGSIALSIGTDSTNVSCHVAADAQVIALSGSAKFNAAKANANTVNVYVENGVIKIQNLTGAAIELKAFI